MLALPKPDSQRVFFIPNVPAALAGFYRAASQTGVTSRIFSGDLFL
jgi:hypothetical protein